MRGRKTTTTGVMMKGEPCRRPAEPLRALGVCLLCIPWLSVGAQGEASGGPRLYTDWEISARTPLLDADGGLAAWGWARHPLMEFDRRSIPASSASRLKEWDFYAISSSECYLELTLANIAWAVLASVTLIDYQSKETNSNLYVGFNAKELILPPDPYGSISYDKSRRHVSFRFSEKGRTLTFDFPETLFIGPHMCGEIQIQDGPQQESLATAMPFDAPGTFFYTNKRVALPASGKIEVADKTHSFRPGHSFAVLDWGRGVWPAEFEWGWAVGAGTVGGKYVGFNIGFGDEDNSRASGNSVVYDGVLHKLGAINWTWRKDDLMHAWHFKSEDNRFDVVLEPSFDQSGEIDLGKYRSKIDKVHGTASGRIVLDDGTVLEITGLMGFAEHCLQRW